MPAVYTTLDLAPAALPDGGGVPPRTPVRPRPRPEDLDLVVDGRALLHRLHGAEGADTVSPLAGDLPPALRAEHVRALLAPDADGAPPLPGGRRVVYSCPDCEDLGCGAVTAVVEHDGQDVVWRDFAWQTGPSVDLEREGYPGVGPYRFDRTTRLTVLRRLGAGPAAADSRPRPETGSGPVPATGLPGGPRTTPRDAPAAGPRAVPAVPHP
ncbi:hypothetical protein ACF09E_10420 [Streptomyces sp. NPDC014891]|uniref:hypothetical protein n=1 Tax=Streptomyces sp. NPDC014891 TaxID=3364929 RepID=UPI003700612C